MTDATPVARDHELMRRALVNALHGWGQTAPNPMVGAVVVSGGEVIADGWHARFGEPHAEIMALRAAGERAPGSTMYVSLEPCIHSGKTPPCAGALIAAGVSRVVVATRDPNPVARGGVEYLRAAGVQVDVGIEEDAARELNAAFFNSFASDRPWVTLKLALSADGGIADPTGKRRWITGEESRREVHRMRAGVDAIAVGSGTVLADDPSLTVRDAPAPRRAPVRVIFDSRLRTPDAAIVVQTAHEVPTTIVTRDEKSVRADQLRRLGVEIVGASDLVDALRRLRDRDIRSVLVEGGAILAGAFARDDLVDRLALFRSPMLLGDKALRGFAHVPAGFADRLFLTPVIVRELLGSDTLMVHAIHDIPPV